MQTILGKIDRSLATVENTLIVVIVTIMLFMGFAQVVLKWMGSGLLWGDPFLRHLVLWVGFIGASLATRDEKHIRIDALIRVTSPRVMPYINIVVDLVTMVVCVVLAHAGYTFVKYEIEAESVIFNAYDIDFPTWIFQVIIPVGFALIAVRFLIKALERVTRLREAQDNVAEETPPQKAE